MIPRASLKSNCALLDKHHLTMIFLASCVPTTFFCFFHTLSSHLRSFAHTVTFAYTSFLLSPCKIPTLPPNLTLRLQRQTLISSNTSLIRLVLPDLPVHIPIGFLLSVFMHSRDLDRLTKTCIYFIVSPKKKSLTALKILCSSCSFCSHL